ncbi:hypothetical protein PG996_001623 [Apiospora saccharicola]|uniref:Uncharacterized protein n=1 Tax=Apiospora saccharicola TaxID=335842 RepID=A0ABR1WHA2_9PEZI
MSPSKKDEGEPTLVNIDDLPPGQRGLPEPNDVMTTTLSELPGYKIVRTVGAVYGCSIDFKFTPFPSSSGLTRMVRCDALIPAFSGVYCHLVYSCTNEALSRIVAETRARGGNAIICMRHVPPSPYISITGTAAVVEKL